MSVFLFVAILSLAVYEAFTVARRRWPGISIRRRAIFVGTVTTFTTAAFILGVSAVYHAFFHNYGLAFFLSDILFGTLSARIVLGVTFGVISGVLLNAFLLAPRHAKMSTGGKILLGLFFLTFLVGVAGEQVMHLLARRVSVSKLSIGGAELVFQDPTQARRSRPEGDPSLSTASRASHGVLNTSPFGLTLLEELPGIIERDQRYIKESLQKRPPASVNEELDNANKALEKAKASVKALATVPIGQCLSQIYVQTGDVEFVRSTVGSLLPVLRDLSTPGYDDANGLAKRGSTALVDLLQVLFKYAYDRARYYWLDGSLRRGGDDNARTLARACLGVAVLSCSELSWKEAQEKVARINGILAEGSGKESRSDAERVGLDEKRLHTCRSDSEGSAFKRVAPGRQQLKSAELASQFKQLAEAQDRHTRPYMSMALAAVFSELGQYQAALIHLNNWVQSEKQAGAADAWLRIRAQLLVVYLSDYWIRREGANAPILLRDFQLKTLLEAMTMMDEVFDFRNVLRKVQHGTTLDSLAAAGFPRGPSEAQCENEQLKSNRDLQRIYWAYLHLYAFSAHHRLLHPQYSDYGKRHPPDTNRAITELWEADLGCGGFGPDDRDSFRAWLLRLYGTMQLRDALALRAARPHASTEGQLERGLRAADLGIRLVQAKAEKDLKSKEHSMNPLLSRLAPTSEIEEYEQLLRVRQLLFEAQRQVD